MPLSNAPSSFDAPMNTDSTASTLPRFSSGVTKRHERTTDEHADHVGGRQHDEGAKRQRVVAGESEHHGADTEHAHDGQQRLADMTPHRTGRHHQRHRRRAETRAARSHP